jgi:hypothetical protein
MQGINSVDSWAQFVSLVQDARTRNQSLSGVKSTVAAGQARIVRRTMGPIPAAEPRRAVSVPPVAGRMAPDAIRAATKPLGSFFDAYA